MKYIFACLMTFSALLHAEEASKTEAALAAHKANVAAIIAEIAARIDQAADEAAAQAQALAARSAIDAQAAAFKIL